MNGEQITVSITDLVIGGRGFDVRPLDDETVQRYQESIDRLPPVEGWLDPETDEIFLVDGRHRCEARRRAGYDDIDILILDCDRAEAEVRAWTANLAHALPLTRAQRRWAITEIVLRRYARTDNWIAEEALCDPKTIAGVRQELESEGKIPALDRLERKGGGTMPRAYHRITGAGEAENAPDFFDELEAAARVNGAADVGEDEESGPEDEQTSATTRPPARPDHAPLPDNFQKTAPSPPTESAPQQRVLKFAQANRGGIALEISIWVEGVAHSVPVTLMFSAGAVTGLPEMSVAENQMAALVLPLEQGRAMNLVYLDNVGVA